MFAKISLMCLICCVGVAKAKPTLCHPPPQWTFYDMASHLVLLNSTSGPSPTNGQFVPDSNLYRSPLKPNGHNVTLIALANFRDERTFNSHLLSNLESIYQHMLAHKMFRSLRFVLVNSKDSYNPGWVQRIRQRVSFEVYQEMEASPVGTLLDGADGDIFIYDRCNLLAYYIPFPLSFLHTENPFLQATLLAAYADSPCRSLCQNGTIAANVTEVTTSTSSSIQTTTPSVTANTTSTTTTFTNGTENEIYSQMSEILKTFYDRYVMETVDMISTTTENSVSASSIEPIVTVSQSVQTDSSLSNNNNGSRVLNILRRPSLVGLQGSTTQDCNQSVCQDWSTENLLKARLCCLNFPSTEEEEAEVSSGQTGNQTESMSISGGFGCQVYGRTRCGQVLPNLQCCTRRLVNDYFDYAIRLREQQQRLQLTGSHLRAGQMSLDIEPNNGSIELLATRLFQRQQSGEFMKHQKRVANPPVAPTPTPNLNTATS